MQISVLTLFPEYFQSILTSSILARGIGNGLLSVDLIALREFGEGKYRAVDDKGYGGGPGMVMMPTVVEAALEKLLGSREALEELERDVRDQREATTHVIYLSPQGKLFNAQMAKRLARMSNLVLLCGHYEGVDERIIEAFVHEEISIGDYVLTGGEPAAAVLIDAVARFIPGVVKEEASVKGDTFEDAPDMQPGGLKYPVYTRPADWRGRKVPQILLSGNHAEIDRWRKEESIKRTQARRPDL